MRFPCRKPWRTQRGGIDPGTDVYVGDRRRNRERDGWRRLQLREVRHQHRGVALIRNATHLLAPGRHLGQNWGDDAEAKRSGLTGRHVSHAYSSRSGAGRNPAPTSATNGTDRFRQCQLERGLDLAGTVGTALEVPNRPFRCRPAEETTSSATELIWVSYCGSSRSSW